MSTSLEDSICQRVFFSISAPRVDAFIRARVAFLNNTTETVYADSLIILMVVFPDLMYNFLVLKDLSYIFVLLSVFLVGT